MTDNQELVKVLTRQAADRRRYGTFMNKTPDVVHRTGPGRLQDSDKLLEELLRHYPDKSALMLDIGAGLGNPNIDLQGITTRETAANPIIGRKARVVASDIEGAKANYRPFRPDELDTMFVPPDFTPRIADAAKTRPVQGPWVMRAANSIDLLMSPEETLQHFNQLAQQAKGKELYYLFNKDVLRKPADSDSFFPMAEINSAGYDHQNKAWESNKQRQPFKLLDSGLKPSVSTSESFDLPEEFKRPGLQGPQRTGNIELPGPAPLPTMEMMTQLEEPRPGQIGPARLNNIELKAPAPPSMNKTAANKLNTPHLPWPPNIFGNDGEPAGWNGYFSRKSFASRPNATLPSPAVTTSPAPSPPSQTMAPMPNPPRSALMDIQPSMLPPSAPIAPIASQPQRPAADLLYQTFKNLTGQNWTGGGSEDITSLLDYFGITAAPKSAEANLALQKALLDNAGNIQ